MKTDWHCRVGEFRSDEPQNETGSRRGRRLEINESVCDKDWATHHGRWTTAQHTVTGLNATHASSRPMCGAVLMFDRAICAAVVER